MFTFQCLFCKCSYEFEENEDPTTSTGCCKACGSDKWIVFDDKGKRIFI